MSFLGFAAGLAFLAGFSPAAIQHVRHEPVQPKPGVPVLVTARLPAGTTKATLKMQAVAPGTYVRKSDPVYEKEWIDLPMRDDGRGRDLQRPRAGDVSEASLAIAVSHRGDDARWQIGAGTRGRRHLSQFRLVVRCRPHLVDRHPRTGEDPAD